MAGAKLLVSWRKTKRYLIFNRQQRLVGWVNIEMRQIKSCYEEVRALEPEIQEGADRVAIKGIVDDSLRLLDVGKLDTLDQAESFLIKYGC